MTNDERYMSKALALALRAEGDTSPNPLVGSVVVRGDGIIGRGYHRMAGEPHAEIEAITAAERRGHDVTGATLYVTLEPCRHTGKRTPPCVNTIIDKRLARVVVGSLDHNTEVMGKGVEMLRQAGIGVETGVLEERCARINEDFFKFITTRVPYITLKMACTLDGRIATRTGESKWIGSERQRTEAHKLRNRADAVLVGIGTVMQDDPRLNVRLPGRKRPLREPVPVVLDSTLRIPPDRELFGHHESPIIAAVIGADAGRRAELEALGARVVLTRPGPGGGVDWGELLAELGALDIMHVLIEGGSAVAASAIRAGVVDKAVLFFAPRLIGGDGLGMFGPLGVSEVAGSFGLTDIRVRRLGEEIVVEGVPTGPTGGYGGG